MAAVELCLDTVFTYSGPDEQGNRAVGLGVANMQVRHCEVGNLHRRYALRQGLYVLFSMALQHAKQNMPACMLQCQVGGMMLSPRQAPLRLAYNRTRQFQTVFVPWHTYLVDCGITIDATISTNGQVEGTCSMAHRLRAGKQGAINQPKQQMPHMQDHQQATGMSAIARHASDGRRDSMMLSPGMLAFTPPTTLL
jgi:hypothetical protein